MDFTQSPPPPLPTAAMDHDSPEVIWISNSEEIEFTEQAQPGSSTGPSTRQAAERLCSLPPLVNINAINPITYSRPLTTQETQSLTDTMREFKQLYEEVNTLNIIRSMQLWEVQTLEAALFL
ncbi:hypothetical protein FA13DRAFT_1707358 [Coprinellus micaceus]|uniref:Uncharacterized protein n=1 Tax=Coprinellus micaceus TaxID=71717 RepID=A0A4Y7TLL9_COPMI|nr:hypothetical protein FA13DRAFT_1707358 [Coprinellus micaceus]